MKRNFRAAVCQRAHEPWTIRSGQCVPNSPADRFVCELGRVKHRSHSDRELAYSISLSRSVALYTSLCVPVAVRWSGVRGKGGWEGWKSGVRERNDGGRGELAEGRFQSVSLAVAPQQWNARSLFHSLFWEVSLLAGALLNSLDYYQMAESTLVVEEHKGRETERQATIQQKGPAGLAKHQGSVQTFITSDWKHHWFTGILCPVWQVNSVGNMM